MKHLFYIWSKLLTAIADGLLWLCDKLTEFLSAWAEEK